jgi:hypothetical protein
MVAFAEFKITLFGSGGPEGDTGPLHRTVAIRTVGSYEGVERRMVEHFAGELVGTFIAAIN